MDDGAAAEAAEAIKAATALQVDLNLARSQIGELERAAEDLQDLQDDRVGVLERAAGELQVDLDLARSRVGVLERELTTLRLQPTRDEPGEEAEAVGSKGGLQEVPAEQLPEGWNKHFDRNHGKPYYVNRQSGVTQWERPNAPAPAPAPTPAPASATSAVELQALELQLVSSEQALVDLNRLLAAEKSARLDVTSKLEEVEAAAGQTAGELTELRLEHQASLLAEAERRIEAEVRAEAAEQAEQDVSEEAMQSRAQVRPSQKCFSMASQ